MKSEPNLQNIMSVERARGLLDLLHRFNPPVESIKNIQNAMKDVGNSALAAEKAWQEAQRAAQSLGRGTREKPPMKTYTYEELYGMSHGEALLLGIPVMQVTLKDTRQEVLVVDASYSSSRGHPFQRVQFIYSGNGRYYSNYNSAATSAGLRRTVPRMFIVINQGKV